MALQGTQRTSRLSQMQMRFQEKQQVERERKKVDILGSTARPLGKVSLAATPEDTKLLTSSLGAGKVRQMFEERRTGVDKAYPLKPISGNTGTPRLASEPQTNGRKVGTVKPMNTATGTNIVTNNNRTLDRDPLNNTIVPKYNSTNRVPALKPTSVNGTASNNNNNNNQNVNPLKTKSPSAATTVIMTTEVRKPESRKSSAIKTPPKSMTPEVKSVSPKKVVAAVATTAAAVNVPPPEGMEQCSICGRNFNEDRIAKHETICSKNAVKKRKVFDSTKHRVQGTEAEVYVKKSIKTKAKPVPEKQTAKKGNWRKKHEEFIAAIRAAKEMQAHLARGGKLSDLPPPPPSENPDYVQCPHCQRRFNQGAAERHIPKCATMLHNKPKPKPVARKR